MDDMCGHRHAGNYTQPFVNEKWIFSTKRGYGSNAPGYGGIEPAFSVTRHRYLTAKYFRNSLFEPDLKSCILASKLKTEAVLKVSV